MKLITFHQQICFWKGLDVPLVKFEGTKALKAGHPTTKTDHSRSPEGWGSQFFLLLHNHVSKWPYIVPTILIYIYRYIFIVWFIVAGFMLKIHWMYINEVFFFVHAERSPNEVMDHSWQTSLAMRLQHGHEKVQYLLIQSLKQTSPLKMGHSKRKLVFQASIFRCYVSFREGTY